MMRNPITRLSCSMKNPQGHSSKSIRMGLYLCFFLFVFLGNAMSITASDKVAYKNADLLVSTTWLDRHVSDKDLIVVDVRESGYASGHIPGAIHLACGKLRDENGLMPIGEIEKHLGDTGIRQDALIVLYDHGIASKGEAGWAFWMLDYLGCKKVRVLDGGWNKWTADNQLVEQAPQTPKAVSFAASVNDRLRADHYQVAHESGQILVDARGDAEYNGWPLDGVARGGHIPGALNMDYRWFYAADQTVLPAAETSALLEGRNISPDNHIIIYGSKGPRAGWMYFVLRLSGYSHASLYDGGALAWASQKTLPLEALPRYQTLVYPQWVKDLMDGKKPAGYTNKRFVILEARYTGFSTSQPGAIDKSANHIPGAVAIHPCYFESGHDESKYYPKYTTPDDGNLLPDEELQKAVAALGITHDTTVVVYGNGKIIPMTSGRVGWSLMVAGVSDVRILNGGITAWKKEGFPVTDTPAAIKPVASFGKSIPIRSDYLASTPYVREIAKGSNTGSVLVDVRAKAEVVGEKCPYPFFDKAGHIPKSVWNGDYWALIDKHDDTWRSYTEIQHMWNKLGITDAVEPVFYCGTAWRSTVGFFHAWLMGYDRMKNYDDSFYGWSFDKTNPIAMSSK